MPEDGKYVAAIERLIGTPIPRIDVDGTDTAELAAATNGKRRPRGKSRGSQLRPAAIAADAPAAKPDAMPPKAVKDVPAPARRTKKERRHREPPDVPVIGMGDHVPAFMLREPVVRKKA
ncbi:MAG: hypothetical protein HC826_00585 [Rhodospirillales bacterium]|nr:hypothetical protein [Rhodospirillales bacterium]